MSDKAYCELFGHVFEWSTWMLKFILPNLAPSGWFDLQQTDDSHKKPDDLHVVLDNFSFSSDNS
jgi:hypothetical protein